MATETLNQIDAADEIETCCDCGRDLPDGEWGQCQRCEAIDAARSEVEEIEVEVEGIESEVEDLLEQLAEAKRTLAEAKARKRAAEKALARLGG